MSVYLCIPSARPDGGTVPLWRAAGYKTALWRDPGAPLIDSNITIRAQYPGYAVACNALIKLVLDSDPECDWVVCGGDDVQPDSENTPDIISAECKERFTGTFGVMQPTGDPWLDGMGRIIERIAGSPWIGREFAQRVNGGAGPWWPEYHHCFCDEELQNVAKRLGVFWQRPDLTHYHDNWARKRGVRADMPEFLEEANSQAHWARYKNLFERRKAGGFPGSEVLECASH